ncbi:EXS family protein [Giardia lamblia P15]|uniref:EXS family protein n=1 Tax=Giardia intestinalis (strain P15) TaxID=658858 RepID=E1F2R9_GIAIA|nr:EXS family protein [Giardia lamblia P15]
MKFGERLVSTLIPEWRQHYLDYDGFKKLLDEHVNDSERLLPVNDRLEAERSEWNRTGFSETFYEKLRLSVKQVESFYQSKCREYKDLWKSIQTILSSEAEHLSAEPPVSVHNSDDANNVGSEKDAGALSEGIETPSLKVAKEFVIANKSLSKHSRRDRIISKGKKKHSHPKLTRSELKDVEENIFELYKSVRMLKEFTSLNETGFIKIAKKHDKMFPTSAFCTERIKELLIKTSFASQSALSNFEDDIERIYGQYYDTKGKGAKKTLVSYCTPMGDLSRQRERLALHTGVSLGFFVPVALMLVDIVLSIILSKHYLIDLPPMCRHLNRFHLSMIIYSLSLAMVFAIYEVKRINYVLILELPSANMVAGANTIAIRALWFSTIHCVAIVMGTASAYTSLSSHGQPAFSEPLPYPFGRYLAALAQLAPYELWLCIPFAFYFYWLVTAIFFSKRHKLRHYCLMVFLRCLNPRVRRINFPQFFFMDQCVSLSVMIIDLCYILSGGYVPDYITAGFLMTFNIIRAMQCGRRYKESGNAYPNIHNMLKYLISIPGCFMEVSALVKILGIKYTLYSVRCAEIIYKLYWDTVEDWALFSGGSGALLFKQTHSDTKVSRRGILQRSSLFSIPTLYFCFFLNIAIRIYLPISLVIPHPSLRDFWIASIAGLLEVFRRNIWNILRLDNQQATNCEGYVISRFIPLLESHEERDKRRLDNRNHNVGT